jgi:pimeloyl-ACP methyl ester carboxylesterase
MLLLLLATLAPDSARTYHVSLARAESLYVTEIGAGRAVVLIPGMFSAAFSYRRVLPLLADLGYRAIVIEPLGFGLSSKPEKADYSLTAQADRIASTIDEIGARGALVIAHSVGNSMALRAEIRHPGVISGIVSLEGGIAERAATTGLRRAARFIPWVKWFGGIKRIRKAMHSGLIKASGDTTWVTEDVIDGYTEGPAADIDGSLKAFLAVAEAREPEKLAPRLGELTIPVLMLVGGARHEGGPPAKELAQMAELLPMFAVDTVPGAGLWLQEERPDIVVEALGRVGVASTQRSW